MGESQESPQCGQRGALGWRHNRYRQGPSGRSEPAREEGSSRCQQEHLGTRGPCITTQRAPQGRRKGCPYRLRTLHKGMEGRHQRQQTGLIWKRPQRPLKDAHVSEGALLASWAWTEEKVVTLTPRGSAFSLEQKGPRDSLATGRSTPGQTCPPLPPLRLRPGPCSHKKVDHVRSYTRGTKARAYSAPHAQNQAQINPSLSGMRTKVVPAAPPQRPRSPPAEGWVLGFQEVWAPERIQVLTETAEAWELLSLSLGSRPREQRQSRVPPQQRLEKY